MGLRKDPDTRLTHHIFSAKTTTCQLHLDPTSFCNSRKRCGKDWPREELREDLAEVKLSLYTFCSKVGLKGSIGCHKTDLVLFLDLFFEI